MLLNAPTRSESDQLVKSSKIISARIVWRPEGRNWRLRVKAFAEGSEESFDITGYIGRTNYGFALLYRNFVLRKFTKHAPHRIGGRVFGEPHKHVWDGETENRIAYVPDDIDPNDDINDQFMSFLKECSIRLVGEYQRVAYQIR